METAINEPMTLAEDAVHQLSVRERLNNMGDGLLARIAIKATAVGASLGIGGAATEMAVSPDAQASVGGHGCVQKLLQPPHSVSAVMHHAGAAHQETIVRASASAVPGCENLKRIEKYRLQVKKAGKWVEFEGPYWYPVGAGNDKHKISTGDYATMHIFTECVNGHREKARVQFQNTVKDLNNDKYYGPGKIRSKAVKTPGC